MNLQSKLKKLRTAANLTQLEAANRLLIPRTTYAGYEQGKREPGGDELKRIADLYGVTVDFLLGRTYTGTINRDEYKDDPEIFELFTKENLKKLVLTKEFSYDELKNVVEFLGKLKKEKTS